MPRARRGRSRRSRTRSAAALSRSMSPTDEAVERAVADAGPVDLLVANAGVSDAGRRDLGDRSRRLVAHVRGQRPRRPPLLPRRDPRDARARVGPDRDHRQRRGLPASVRLRPYRLPGEQGRGLPLRRDARRRARRPDPGLLHQPRARAHRDDLVGTPDDAPWTPPELAPRLVAALATGRYDALAGRYLHAEHDDVDDLLSRLDDVREQDLNAIRLRR